MVRKIIFSLLLLVVGSICLAESDDIFDVIAGGAEEYQFVRYSPEEISLKIREDMLVACENGLCTLFVINDKGGEFKFEFNAGYSQGITSDEMTTTGGPSVGVTASYTYKDCTQSIRVPRSIYDALNRQMYTLIQEDGSAAKTITPAAEAAIVFYTTLMKQATGC